MESMLVCSVDFTEVFQVSCKNGLHIHLEAPLIPVLRKGYFPRGKLPDLIKS